MSRSALLIGPPGSGKSTMACLTAPNKPVHVIDVDRKISAMANLKPAINKGELTYWEVDSPLIEGSLSDRAVGYAKNLKPTLSPRGWLKFAELVSKLDREEPAKSAGTWFIDSFTRVGEHLKRLITHLSEKGHATLVDREWGTYLGMFEETTTTIIDAARDLGKDVLFSVHERVSEVPGDANVRVIKTKDREGIMRREYLGPMEVKIAASIEGQFGIKIGTYFAEVYGLGVELDKEGNPKWTCRILPDGRRDLRTSYEVKSAIVEPDLSKIWSR